MPPAPDARPEPPLVARARVLIQNQLGDQALSVKRLAGQLGCTADYLSHVFSQTSGEHLAAYINRQRMERGAHLLREGGLALCHHPTPRDDGFVVAGHLHPCVSVHGRARERLRLPCFHLGAQVLVLPAFGSFTGMHPVRHIDGDRVFAIAGDAVHEVPT